MPLYRFSQSDIFHNRIEARPRCNFFIYSGSIYYNNRPSFHGQFTTTKARADLKIVNRNPDDTAPDISVTPGLDNDTITLIDAEKNEVTFKFDRLLTTVDGSVGSSGNVIVGIKEADTLAKVMIQLRAAINNVTDYTQSDDAGSSTDYTLNITAARVSGTRILVLEQDTAGGAGNTTITIDSSGINTRIEGPPSFTGGNSASDQQGLAAGGVPAGYVSLYELNVDRVSGSSTEGQRDTGAAMPKLTSPDIIYPFIIKDGNNNRFRGTTLATIDNTNVLYDESVQYGDLLTGSYPMSASIVKEYLAINHVERAVVEINEKIHGDGSTLPSIHPYVDEFGYPTKTELGPKIAALRNTLNSYIYLSPHYAYSSSSYANLGQGAAPSVPGESINWNKARQEIGLISIPSIIYGREIEKGTVNLKFYITGTLVGELNDKDKNGELVQVGPAESPYSGSTAGVVLYNEGFILLTGSWDLTAVATASAAEFNFTKAPSNNDAITVTNAAGTEKAFKFTTGNATVDGSLHSDGISVNVGIGGSPSNGGANRFKNAVNNADIDITATRSSRVVTLTQDVAGLAGNTDIVVDSDVANLDPTPSKFAGGIGGVSAPIHTEKYYGSTATAPRWIDFAQTIATGSLQHMPSSSFELDFKGTTYTPVMTMLAHARKGHLNFSNNPTYIRHSQSVNPIAGSTKFREPPELEIKNTVSSSYQDFTASYKRQTYISKIGIYDAKRNLIGIAKVATPVKKTEDRDFTFKLKLDF